MKRYLQIFLSSFLSGFCIVIGAFVYLIMLKEGSTNGDPYLFKILGSLFFGLGLFTIIHCGLWLYTGKVGLVLDNKPKYVIDLVVCALGNFLGVIFLASLLKLTRSSDLVTETAKNLVKAKQNDSWYSIYVLSCLCGVMIYLAVKGHQICPYTIGKVIFVFLAVSIFILCGYEHCIANAAYYTFASVFNGKAFLYFIIMILGNATGSIFFDGFLKLINYLKKSETNN